MHIGWAAPNEYPGKIHGKGDLMTKPEAAIFDLDGSLVDSEPPSLGAVTAEMRAIGFTGGSHLDGVCEAHAARLLTAGAEIVLSDTRRICDAIRPAPSEPGPKP